VTDSLIIFLAKERAEEHAPQRPMVRVPQPEPALHVPTEDIEEWFYTPPETAPRGSAEVGGFGTVDPEEA
jgi:hypothetical protein